MLRRELPTDVQTREEPSESLRSQPGPSKPEIGPGAAAAHRGLGPGTFLAESLPSRAGAQALPAKALN